MDNLRTLCAVADAQTRFVIASAGGELVEMSEDKVRSSYHPVHLLWVHSLDLRFFFFFFFLKLRDVHL